MRHTTISRAAMAALALTIGVFLMGCSSAITGASRTVSTNYTMSVIQASTGTIGTLIVMDTLHTDLNGNEVVRVIFPGDIVDSVNYLITGSGPSGTGDYLMRVVLPGDVIGGFTPSDDYLYVSGM